MKNIVFALIILLFIFYDALEHFSMFSEYPVDEVIVVVFGVYIIIHCLIKPVRLLRYEITIVKLYTLLIIVSLIISIINDYNQLFNIFLDIWLLSKFLIAYFFTRFYLSNESSEYFSTIVIFRKIVSVVGFTCLLVFVNSIFGIFESHEYRWGIETQKLFFSHPTYLASVLIIGMLMNIDRKNVNIISFLFYASAIFLTGRNKGILFLLVMIGIYFLYRYYKKINFFYVFIIAIPPLLLFKDIVVERLLSASTSARYILYETAFKIASVNIPFGSGLASFGSYASIYEYSSIYADYGLSALYGFTEENPQYLTDSFYAMILGQFGYFGILIFGLILYLFLKILRNNVSYVFFSTVSYIYLLMSLSTENFLSTGLGIGLFIIYGLITTEMVKEKRRSNEENSN